MNRGDEKQAFLEVDLYPVTCERLSAGRSDVDVLRAAIEGGARIIHSAQGEGSLICGLL